MERRKLKSGGIEYRNTPAEEVSKKKYKTKKKPSDLANKDVQELVYELARRANLI